MKRCALGEPVAQPSAAEREARSTSKVEQQTVSDTADTAAVSWTGGKDCNLALLTAWRDPSLHVKSLVCFRPEDAKFRAHPIVLVEAQAKSLGLQLHHVLIPKGTTDYKTAYVSGMRKLREEHGIMVIATGDMDLVGDMSRNWIEECGEEAGIRAFLPLWQADRRECLARLLAEGFVIKARRRTDFTLLTACRV